MGTAVARRPSALAAACCRPPGGGGRRRKAGDDAREAEVQAKMPKCVKKRRLVQGDDGEENGWEEYFDYIFPDEEKKAPSLKILEMAHKWKKQKTGDEDE